MNATMGRKPKDATADATAPKRQRNAIFVTLDEVTESRLQLFLERQRIKPDRAAVALTAIVEFLDREGIPTPKVSK